VNREWSLEFTVLVEFSPGCSACLASFKVVASDTMGDMGDAAW
jgi:hypothetical protein